jgi:hypothetical protein
MNRRDHDDDTFDDNIIDNDDLPLLEEVDYDHLEEEYYLNTQHIMAVKQWS